MRSEINQVEIDKEENNETKIPGSEESGPFHANDGEKGEKKENRPAPPHLLLVTASEHGTRD